MEGYTDVMAMHQQGVENVVASSGTALTHEQIRLIHRFTENITVIYDGDAAGIKASQRGIDMLLAEGMTVRLLLLPDGDDPDSFARKHTATEYQEYLTDHQVDFIRFKTDLLLNEAQGDPIKLSRLVNNIVDSLAVIPDEITRTFYIKETSQMLSIEERIITSAVAKVRKRMRDERQKERERERNANNTNEQNSQKENSATESQDSNPLPPTDIPPEVFEQETHSPAELHLQPSHSHEDEKIIGIERQLIQVVVRHGEKVMCQIEDEEAGQERALKVAEYVSYALANDGLQLRNPLHRRILDEALQHYQEDGFRCDRYFENHPDMEIANLANELAHDPEALSKIHEKGIPVKPEEERLVELMPQLMIAYKLAIVRAQLRSLMQQMGDPEIQKDQHRADELMHQFMEQQTIQKELSHQCGDRVINL